MKRNAKKVFDSEFRVDGDFIHFDSAIGYDLVQEFDPFLLFDMYGMNRQPDQRVFHNPYHAHRGMQTITYIREGFSTHKTLEGEKYELEPGTALLTSAGKGVIHDERTVKKDDRVSAVQIWINLAKKDKMSDPFQENVEVRSVERDGVFINVIAGSLNGVTGISSKYNDLEMYELELPINSSFINEVAMDKTVFIFVDQGEIIVEGRVVRSKQIALLCEGDSIDLYAKDDSVVFYFEATPHKEPIAWGGTLVMNDDSELEKASEEILNGTFGKDCSE